MPRRGVDSVPEVCGNTKTLRAGWSGVLLAMTYVPNRALRNNIVGMGKKALKRHDITGLAVGGYSVLTMQFNDERHLRRARKPLSLYPMNATHSRHFPIQQNGQSNVYLLLLVHLI
jgi:hypothetical protein